MHCDGKCCLKKRLAKEGKDQVPSPRNQKSEQTVTLFFTDHVPAVWQAFVEPVPNHYFNRDDLRTFSFHSSVFHPPAAQFFWLDLLRVGSGHHLFIHFVYRLPCHSGMRSKKQTCDHYFLSSFWRAPLIMPVPATYAVVRRATNILAYCRNFINNSLAFNTNTPASPPNNRL